MNKRKKKSVSTDKKAKSRCQSLQTEQSGEQTESGEYWAEAILDWGLHDNGTIMYWIKWLGYPEDQNSWEFESNVVKCGQLLTDFHDNNINGKYPPKWSFEEFHKFCKYIENLIQNQDLAVFRRLTKSKINCFQLKSEKFIEEIKTKLSDVLNLIRNQLNKYKTKTNRQRLEAIEVIKKAVKTLNIDKSFGSITNFLLFIDKRETFLKDLEEWEQNINEVIENKSEGKPVRVVNHIDFDKPELKRYITDYMVDTYFKNEVELEGETPLVGCECTDCYECKDECCTAVIGFPMVYNKKGILDSKQFNNIIYECNSKCNCGADCPNRRVQKGRQFSLEIFRTDSRTRGWGVRTLDKIPKGAFITHYTGELISLEEAEKRPSTYLFDLSGHLHLTEDEFTYVIDASRYGNVTRFVNHSCDPNCRVLFTWINRSSNQLLPIIALFAEKNIDINEELNYDYSMELIDYINPKTGKTYKGLIDQKNNDSQGLPVLHSIVSKTGLTRNHLTNGRNRRTYNRIDCECGALNCRNYLYA